MIQVWAHLVATRKVADPRQQGERARAFHLFPPHSLAGTDLFWRPGKMRGLLPFSLLVGRRAIRSLERVSDIPLARPRMPGRPAAILRIADGV